jgi:O-antigen/teichoic acid export membrane protein
MVSAGLTSAAGAAFWIIAAHHWSASQIGVASSLVAALTIVVILIGVPVSTLLLLRMPSSEHRRVLFEEALVSTAAVTAVAAVIAVLVLPTNLSSVRNVLVAVFFISGCIAGACGMVVDGASIAVRRPGLMVRRSAIVGFGKLAALATLAVLLTRASAPATVVGVWACASVAATVVVASLWMRASTRPDERPVRARSLGVLARGLAPITTGALGGSLPPQILPVIVITTLGRTPSAWFNLTWLVASLCFMISPSVCQALLAEGAHSPHEIQDKTRTSLFLSSALLAGPVLVYLLAGRRILDVFGPQYGRHGSTLLAILAISAIPDMITNIGVANLRVREHLWASAAVNVCIALVAVVGTALAIGRFGINGAGWAWLAAELFGCLVLAAIMIVLRTQKVRAVAEASGATT